MKSPTERIPARSGVILKSNGHAKKVIALVKQGSVDDILLLGNHFAMVNRSLAVDALSALLESTRTRSPPDTEPSYWTKDETVTIQVVMSAMSAITISLHYFDPPKLESLSLTLSSHFSHILPWLRFFFDNAGDVATLAYARTSKTHFLLKVINTLGVFSRCDMTESFLFTHESVELVAKFWLTATGKTKRSASQLLLNVFRTAKAVHTDLVQDILCSDVENTARIAMQRLRGSLQGESLDFENMLFSNIALTLADQSSSLRQALANKGIISDTSKAALLILGSYAGDNYIYNRQALILYTNVMPRLIHTKGLPGLFEAVRSGLFNVIDKTILSLDLSDDYSKCLLSAFRYTYGYLQCYSFVGIAVEAMRSLQSEDWNSCKRNKGVASDWKAFKNYVISRAIIKSKYDRWLMRRKSCCESCDREICGEMKMCAGCEEVFYCSKACQAMSWKEKGHRERCKNKQHRPQHSEPPFLAYHSECTSDLTSIILLANEWGKLKRRDREFIHVIATMDIRRHIPALLALAAAKFPDTPPILLGFGINYDFFPPILDVFSLIDLFYASDMPHEQVPGVVAEEVRRWAKSGGVDARKETGHYIRITLPDTGFGEAKSGSSTYVPPKFFDGMDFDGPRLRRGAGAEVKRMSGHDIEGRTLEAEYDEVDEIIRQMQFTSWSSLWDKLDKAWDAADKPNWPF
ncbi:hypothetical protein DFH11DRAFT_392495 [Phellopilus nigrolimitatus]|nr:hypothetical protein DFH11DRAFT_392495 [Phellopilus nigrolimitatus]